MVGLCFSIKIQTKLKLIIVIYFAWIVILLRSFLLVLGFFYILAYYFYQILGNALLVVKIHQKNTLFLSTITKQYFF